MIVDIDDIKTPFTNAFTALKTKYPDSEIEDISSDQMWWKNYEVKLHWHGGWMDKLEFKSEEDYLVFLLRFS
jgi:hypothetical protein